MKFYTVCVYQPLIFEWVKANLFVCHLHYLFSLLEMVIFTEKTAEWYLTSVNYWLVMQYYVQFLQQIKMQNKNSCVVEMQVLFVCMSFWEQKISFSLHI